MRIYRALIAGMLLAIPVAAGLSVDTLSPLENGRAPGDFEEM